MKVATVNLTNKMCARWNPDSAWATAGV